MNPKVIAVSPLPGYRLALEFANGERRQFDVSPYLDRGVFRKLRDPAGFAAVGVVAGSVEWSCEVDLSYDTLYLGSVQMQDARLQATAA